VADTDLVPSLVRGVLGTVGVLHGHDLVMLLGANEATDDRYVWVGEPAHARALAALLCEQADRAEAAMAGAVEDDRRAGWLGPCGHDGCDLPPGHAGRHDWQGGGRD
jgi:hypothetical protein